MKPFREYISEGVSDLVRLAGSSKTIPFWFNPKTNKLIVVGISAPGGPWHATAVAKDPRKFGTTKEEILKYMEKWDREWKYYDDFEQTAESFYDDIVNQVKDISTGIQVLMGEKGFFKCTLMRNLVSGSLGEPTRRGSVQPSKSQWRDFVGMISLVPGITEINLNGFSAPGQFVPLYKTDFEFFTKYGRVPQRTEVGSRMAQFREWLEERFNRKIRVFDFDDTLVKTDAYVIVTDRQGNKRQLTPGEYAVYEKKPGEVFDYSQFQKVINPRPLRAIEKILREVLRSGSEAEILTARGNYETIKAYLKMRGIEGIFVHALGSSDPKLKGAHLQALINSGYDFIEFFEDSPKNIEAAKEVAEKNKGRAKIRLRHVK